MEKEITTVSSRGCTFVLHQEGVPLVAYLDPIGVPTLYAGFTMKSSFCRAELAKIGITKIVPGKTRISSEDGNRIFEAVLNNGYGREVVAHSPSSRKQCQLDAATSAAYNLGVRVVSKWTFGKLWRAEQIKAAADYLASHYNTAGGRKLPGLVRRRKQEGRLFEDGVYSGVDAEGNKEIAPDGVPREATASAPTTGDPVVSEVQTMLKQRGFKPGKVDGWMGKRTKAAVLAYQKAHPHLQNNGIIDKATISQLHRDAMATKDIATKSGASAVISGATAWGAGLPVGWIVFGVLVIAAVWLGWRYRDVIVRRINTVRGRVVDV